MRTMKLADVKAKTGVEMTPEEARKLASPVEPFLSNMILALNLMTWLNTKDDWLRLQAGMVLKAANRKRAA
jgi:hypothetical protein